MTAHSEDRAPSSAARRPSPADDPARRRAFRRGSGFDPDPHGFIGRDTDLTPDQLLEWLRIDQHRRWQTGEPIPVGCYLERFPQVRANSGYALDLIWSEFLIREELGDRPNLEEYTRVFPPFESLRRRQHEVHLWVDQARDPNDLTLAVPDLPPVASPSLEGAGASGMPAHDPAPADFRPVLPNHFEILGEIGRGGMGIVYRVHDRRCDRFVAVKIMRATPTWGCTSSPQPPGAAWENGSAATRGSP
jgi:serine/threonine-protein kinase